MKLTVIGGGGVRSMFLAKSIAQRAEELHIDELVFMDNDPEKLRIYGGLAAHVARMLCPTMKFTLTSSAEEAVTDADYVITTIRVGGDATRVRDERLALDLGILGQETTGAAGVSFAMRSIPALAEYCELIKKLAKPGVKVFNFTNPAGVVSQALRDMGYDFTYGICDAPSGMLHQFADLYGVDASRIYGECYGLNHLSYFQSIKVDGKEIMPELIANDEAYAKTDMRFFEKRLLEDRGHRGPAGQLAPRRFGQCSSQVLFQRRDAPAHEHHRMRQPRRVAKQSVQQKAAQHRPKNQHVLSFVYCTVLTKRSSCRAAQSRASST
mgnify:CR=1 FL=1